MSEKLEYIDQYFNGQLSDPEKTAFPLIYEVDYVRVSQKTQGQYKKIGRFIPGNNAGLAEQKKKLKKIETGKQE